MKPSKIIKTLVILAFIAGGGYIVFKKAFEKKPPEHLQQRYSKVMRQDLIQRVTIAGNVEPERKTIVTAPFNGYVKKLYVKIGQQVKKDDPIVSIVQSLQSVDPIYPLRAPFSGTIVAIQKQEGEFVKQDDPNDFILRIDSLENLFINSDVPEIDMIKIKVGQEAIIKASAILDVKFKGIIENISLASRLQDGWRSNSKVEYPTRIKILKPFGEIKPGMSTLIDIVTKKKENVLVLPHEYILKEKDKFYVLLRSGAKKEIQIGMQNEAFFEIIDGVSEGESVRQINFLDILEGPK